MVIEVSCVVFTHASGSGSEVVTKLGCHNELSCFHSHECVRSDEQYDLCFLFPCREGDSRVFSSLVLRVDGTYLLCF